MKIEALSQFRFSVTEGGLYTVRLFVPLHLSNSTMRCHLLKEIKTKIERTFKPKIIYTVM